MSTYEIAVHGCDDTTTVTMPLVEYEHELLQRVAVAINAASEYHCMPRMSVHPTSQESAE